MQKTIDYMFFDNKYTKVINAFLEKAFISQDDKNKLWVVVYELIKKINEKLGKLTSEKRIILCKEDIRLFSAYYFKTYLFPHQLRWLGYLDRYNNIQLIAPRGHSKSVTTLKIKPLYEIIKNKNVNICFICNTHAKAEERVTLLRNELVLNERLTNDFGVFFDRKQYTTSRTSEFTIIRDISNEFRTIKGHGWDDKNKTGGHYDIIINDDICEIEDARSLKKMNNMETEFFGNIMNLVKDKKESKVVVIGTRKGIDDIYGRIKERDTFITIEEQAIIQGYEYLKEKDCFTLVKVYDGNIGQEVVYDIQINEKYINKFKVLWSFKWDISSLLLNYVDNHTEFNREMQGYIAGGSGNIFKVNEYTNYDDINYTDIKEIIFGIDLSYGSGVDDSAVVVVGKDAFGTLYVLDGYANNELSTNEFYKHIEQLYIRYADKTLSVIMETNAGFKEVIRNYNEFSRDNGTYIPFNGVKHSKAKNVRIESTLLHLFENETLYLPSREFRKKNPFLNALYSQLMYFNVYETNQKDDIVDALEMAVSGFTRTIKTEFVYKERKKGDFAKKKKEQLNKFKL